MHSACIRASGFWLPYTTPLSSPFASPPMRLLFQISSIWAVSRSQPLGRLIDARHSSIVFRRSIRGICRAGLSFGTTR